MANPLAAFSTSSPAQPTPRPENPLARFATNDGQSGPAPEPSRSALDYLGETISNIPSSAGAVASDLWQAVSNPLDTAAALGSAVMGGGQLLKDAVGLPSPGLLGEHRPAARAVGDFYSERYGGFDALADTLRTDPIGTALDFGGVLTGGAAAGARVPGTAGKLARSIVQADPVAAAGRAAAAAGRAGEVAYRGRSGTPSKAQFIADAPGPEALQRQGSQLFEQAEKSGVRFKAGPFGEFADSLLARLVDEGADPVLSPKISRVADILEKSKTRAPSIAQLSILRRQFSNAAGSADKAEARLGGIAIDLLDDFVESGASAVGGDLKAARVFWSRLKKSELIDAAIENASTAQGGLEAGLRAEFKTLWRARDSKKMRGFSDAELNAIKAVATGNMTANVLRRIGSSAAEWTRGEI